MCKVLLWMGWSFLELCGDTVALSSVACAVAPCHNRPCHSGVEGVCRTQSRANPALSVGWCRGTAEGICPGGCASRRSLLWMLPWGVQFACGRLCRNTWKIWCKTLIRSSLPIKVYVEFLGSTRESVWESQMCL